MHVIRNILSPYLNDTAFWNHFSGEETTLALFAKITPLAQWNLPTVGFTSHAYDITLSAHSLTFVSSKGLNLSVAEIEGGKAANVEMVGVFEDDNFQEADLIIGKWNNASVELWLMNWNDTAMGELVVQSDFVSDIKNYQTYFKAELRGRSALMETNFGELTSRTCRALQPQNGGFGGTQCKKDLTGTVGGIHLTKTLTVSAVTSRTQLSFTRLEAVSNTFYTNGKITGVTGGNEDIVRQIQTAAGFGSGTVDVVLRLPFPITVAVGDTFSLVAGCSGTLEKCKEYGNAVNRRAEDFISSIESLIITPATQ